MIYKYTLFL